MVERKKVKEGSSLKTSSVKSSKESIKAAIFVPPKKLESKIDGVGEFECSTIVSTSQLVDKLFLVCLRNVNLHNLGRTFGKVTNSHLTFQAR
jgi:hypothetical protein